MTNCVNTDEIPQHAVYNLDLHCSQVFNLTDTWHSLINAQSHLKKYDYENNTLHHWLGSFPGDMAYYNITRRRL